MSDQTRREPPCLSDLRLDQLLSGELTKEREQAARAHLAACARCEGRRLELALDRAAFAEKEPSFADLLSSRGSDASGLRQVPLRPSPKVWRSPILAGAAALSAALVALGVGFGRLGIGPESDGLPTAGGPPATVESTRAKGARPALALVVKRGWESFWAEPGQVLAPGDELRFALSSDRPLYAGVWGVDALGRTSAYHGSSELSRVEAGHRQPLPGASVLDDSLGEERLVAVYCTEPVPGAELASAVSASPTAPRMPPECTHELLTIVKAAR